ncbi:Uncharacterised protein [Leclercia adecarboxylata]|uniref:Uncharacterized protein n=1 Tax=Leclercia adecarboxylata TaxID=83655 RepID=A0A4U9IP06_9ENTR|nr:Uncharacterised protein [Leclercia adecarboxylata]
MTPFMTEDFLLDTEFAAACTTITQKTSRFSTTTAIFRRSRLPKITASKTCMTSG